MKTHKYLSISLLLIVLILSVLQISNASTVIDKQTNKRQDNSGLKWKMVWLWSMGDKSDAEIVSSAKSLGFNAVIARGPKMIEECHKQGLQAVGFVCFAASSKEFAQKMTPKEEERLISSKASPLYQEGGEPILASELFRDDLWCLDKPEALIYGKREIDKLINAGCDVIAFDYIGYKNYYACFCQDSCKKHYEYQKKHPRLSKNEAIRKYSLNCLVKFYKSLIQYAKAKKPDVVITCHIYPYFDPEPLYGNRLPVDYCGQTASWFFQPHWSLNKVNRYARNIVAGEAKYNSKSIGAPFLGIYTFSPYEKHKKTAEQVRNEIRIVKQAGARAIMFAELGNILNDPAMANVVREELSECTLPAKN